MISPVSTRTVLLRRTNTRLERLVVRLFSVACFVFLVTLIACSDEPEPVQLYSFERPEKVALACFEIGDMKNTPVELEKCRPEFDDDGSVKETRYHLHALVTQTSRGEVAAVDLTEKEVIDTREDIPGITFVPVGDIPKAIVVPPKHDETTYVADFGSRDVLWLPTDSFRPDSESKTPDVHRVSLGGRPVDMVLSPDDDESFLYVTVPDLSAVVRLSRGEDGSIIKVETLRLPEYEYDELRQIQAAIPIQDYIEQEAYQYSCNYTFSSPTGDAVQRDFADLFACVELESADSGFSMDGETDEEVSDASFEIDASVGDDIPIDVDSGSDSGFSTTPDETAPDSGVALDCSSLTPNPTAIAIDRIDDTRYRLLIADDVLPVIHVIEIDSNDPDGFSRLIRGETELPKPIVTAVPIRDLAVTPWVPKSVPVPESAPEADSGTQSDAGFDTNDSSDANDLSDIDAGVPFDASTDASVESVEDAQTLTSPDAQSESEQAPTTDGAAQSESEDAATTDDAAQSESEEAPTTDDKAKYIYAIDDLDGSVLVVDAATGAVLTTHSQPYTQADRIPLNNAVATALEIITPQYVPESEAFNRDWCKCGITDETAPVPNRLYGVYLTVATTDGMIRVVDVHDMNAVASRECRHIACIEDGERAFIKEGGKTKQDENGNASYVLDTTSNAADFCSKSGSCTIDSKDDDYYDIDEDENSECSCCMKDEGGDVSENREFSLAYNYGENAVDDINACQQCLGPDGTPIDFDPALCQRCVNDEGDDIALAIRRHFPRLRFVGGTGAPISDPAFMVEERRQDVRDDGKSFGTERHDLVGIECDSELGMAQSFPDPRNVAKKVDTTSPSDNAGVGVETNIGEDTTSASGTQTEEPTEEDFVHQSGDALVCTRSDPWTANGADWIVQYEGLIWGASGFDGKFVDKEDEEFIEYGAQDNGTIQFRSSDIDFCRGGVLGTEDIKPKYLVITSQLFCGAVSSPVIFEINGFDNGRYDLKLLGDTPAKTVYDCLVGAVDSNIYTYRVVTDSLALIPGLAFARGYFLEPYDETAGTFEFIGEADLERLSGDMLVITAIPQEEKTIELAHELYKKEHNIGDYKVEDCENLTKPLPNGYPPRAAFQIIKAYQDHLVIEDKLIADQRPEKIPATYKFIRFCMANMLMKFEMRVHNAYAVYGNAPSFLHDVTATAEKRCWPGDEPLQNSRAYERVEFRNREVAFKLAAQGTPSPGFRLEIGIPPVSKVMVDIGSFGYPYPDFGNLPVTLMFNDLYDQLLVVDMGLRGLVPIELENTFPDTLATGAAMRYQ